METYTELRAAKQVSDARNSFNEFFPDETCPLGELCDGNAEALRLGISMPVASLAPSLDDEAARRTAPPALDCVRVAPALDDFVVMPRAERATRIVIAARGYARHARAYPDALRRDRFIRARAVFRRKARALAANARAAIVGALAVFSRAARPSRRPRRPAAKAKAKASADGDGAGDEPERPFDIRDAPDVEKALIRRGKGIWDEADARLIDGQRKARDAAWGRLRNGNGGPSDREVATWRPNLPPPSEAERLAAIWARNQKRVSLAWCAP